jgi:uncharacterized protein (TIGR03437 family)
MLNSPLILSAASPSVQAVAPGSLVSANGQNLAAGYPGPIFGVLPTVFDGTSVSIIDSAGRTTIAPLFYVSPDQVDFEVPATVATGLAKVVVDSNGVNQTAANVQISAVAPALFTLNNSGLAASYALRVSAGGTQTVEQVYSQDNTGLISANPINLGSSTDQAYLILYGTGFDTAGTSNVMATVNGVNAPVLYAGPGGSAGLDQVNILLPASLAGSGNVNVQLTAAGVVANPVQVTIQ